MTGSALSWFKWMYSNRQLSSWDAFVRALEVRFGPSSYDNHQAALFKLRQTSSVSDYQAHFEQICNWVIGLPPEAILNCFVSWLRVDIQRKKKSSKKNNVSSPEIGDGDANQDQHTDDSKTKKQTSEDVADTSKNKKKKKKRGKAGQEEEDLDKILAELGEAPPLVAPVVPPPGEKVQSQPELEEAAVEDETKKETKTKVPDKKVPKHVREMQEKLAKAKEAEERRKREEEEWFTKQEEERLRLEELEGQAEQKKRLKKEREKEKLLKKKQEGKKLAEPSGAPTKRPLYQKKKSKQQAQSNGAATLDSVESTDSKEIQHEIASELEAKNLEEVESVSATDIVEENGVDEEEEEDDDEEWDAKSWDDADLKLPGKSVFSDEEVDSEPEPLLKKENVASTLPLRSEKVEGTDKNTNKVPVNPDNKNKKEALVKEETLKSDDTPVQSGQNLRSPICCIMGHVDAGKTKLLDCIRGTNVQEGEAGEITQQIGATYFPAQNIRERTRELKADAKLNVPGLLVIDTPGHESFTNLRSRGSGLCDIAILVVDIMHGLEPQTIESLNLLKMRNTEFIVARNKVDRLYGWKTCKNAPITKAMKQQSKDVQFEFNTRLTQVVTQFKEQGLNTELYYKNKEMGETFSIVPTSAISGEGIPDMLLLLVQWTQKTMIKRLTFSNEMQCTVLEVKVIEGYGTTIDVVLVNGVLHEGDQIVVCGLQVGSNCDLNQSIVNTASDEGAPSQVTWLLLELALHEIDIVESLKTIAQLVIGTYLHHKEIKAAQGIKITAQGLEHAIAGTSLYVVGPHDDLEDIKEATMEDMKSVMSRIDKSGEGVYVQASTLGSLEALLEFLKPSAVNIPVSGISIGPVHKKDVIKASVMLEKKKEYGTILAFDVKITQEARELADELGVKIFIADIIYHLFDQFKAYIDNLKKEKKKEAAEEAVFPCVLKIMPNCVFNKKDPIVLGVDVLEGTAKIGTPICVPQREFIEIGRIASIENNHKPVDSAKKGQKVAIKIIGSNSDERQKMFGRHFEMEDELEDLSVEEKRLLFKMKKLFKIF
ncbi:hypothetical protein BUALT_Bualt02G0100700 [Buddleja alternifolia]|uniref:Eukaryotic translation initiation factor 5B n=1 Tax=Buddleja alternifolia TaxID=168488 RepID=A0AAV6Y5B7_9LAMI|nr:hypothetical protein BUALT_Bualt02G0100700 [Buddleja alternifolia]